MKKDLLRRLLYKEYFHIMYYIDNFGKVLNISDYIGIIAYGSYVKKTKKEVATFYATLQP